jgi:hypothetical protein
MSKIKNTGINWSEIIPYHISDEAAYALLVFVTQIASSVEERFYAQAIQYGEDHILPGVKSWLQYSLVGEEEKI